MACGSRGPQLSDARSSSRSANCGCAMRHWSRGNLGDLLSTDPWAAREILYALDRIRRSLWPYPDNGRVHLSLSGTLLEILACSGDGREPDNDQRRPERTAGPGPVRRRDHAGWPGDREPAGPYAWDIGTAGSATMLALAILPVLALCGRGGEAEIRGGLFQDFAPSAFHPCTCCCRCSPRWESPPASTRSGLDMSPQVKGLSACADRTRHAGPGQPGQSACRADRLHELPDHLPGVRCQVPLQPNLTAPSPRSWLSGSAKASPGIHNQGSTSPDQQTASQTRRPHRRLWRSGLRSPVPGSGGRI
jgi:hypothetical protein